MYENSILLIPSLFFITVMIILFYKYYDKIINAKKEYDVAKQLVSNIVLTFRKRSDDQNEKVDSIIYDVEELQSSIEKSRIQENYFQDKINSLIKCITSAFIINKKLVDKLLDINIKIDELKKYDELLYNTIESFKKERTSSTPNFFSIEFRLSPRSEPGGNKYFVFALSRAWS